ncbi:MAG: WG repeat-containing protein [Methanobrevibacter sp.]|nr:WG repeat-containing protein [Methanobrevibacter sp.]
MRTLYITEEQERSLKNRVILAESDDRIKKVNKIIDTEFSNLLNLNEPVSGPEYYVNNNPETTWRTYLLFSLRHTFGLMTNADMKYLPVVAKLAYSDEVGFDKRNDNGNKIGILLKIVGLFKKDDALFQKVKANINNITFSQLYEQLKPQLEQSSTIDAYNANHVKERDDYDVVEVPDFQTANFYGNKSCSVSKLCYTQNEHTWNEYTKNGINKVYVCLKHGWENIPEEVGEGNPYDEYGTSMIFVFIDPEGNITTSNCRWNHRTEGEYNGSVDHAFTKTTLCETVGKRFDEAFKPHSTEYLMKKGYVPFDTVQELLDNGEKPEEIFNYCGDFCEGFAVVQLNGKYNYINANNQLISDTWFDYCGYFRKGFACVELYGKYNFINTNGQIISDTWFDDCYAFYNGFAYVRLNNKCNFINTDGQLLSNTWFDGCGIFKNGFARVELNNKYNFINTNGQLLSNTWFDDCGGFDNGFAIVKLDGEYKLINTNGQIVESKGRKNKHIIITEEQEKALKESILLNSFPEDIADAVYKNKTSIGNNPALPNIFEKGYVEKLVEKRFKGCVDELKKIGEIDDVPDTDMQTVLGKLVLKCQKLEEPHRPELEKIVANYLIDLFGIPDDSIQMELSLVDDVDLSSSSIKLDPADGDEFIEYEDVLDAESIKDEVYKRRLIDAISMGAGMKISSNIKDYMKEIYEINPTLIDLYRKILALNDYLLFTKEDIGMTEEDKHQFGTVEVVLGQVEESPKILAQGVIFPILLSESVRGLMELFASHGLPQEFEKAQSVLSKSDYLKAEPWDMRIGPALWEIVSDSFGNGVKTDLIPYLYKRISQLPVKKFNFFMREVLAKTRKGKRMMAKIAEKAQYEKEYSGFEDKMSKFSTDKNVIMDEYIHPDEL